MYFVEYHTSAFMAHMALYDIVEYGDYTWGGKKTDAQTEQNKCNLVQLWDCIYTVWPKSKMKFWQT